MADEKTDDICSTAGSTSDEPVDKDYEEVNIDGWSQKLKTVDASADTPFKMRKLEPESELTPEEQEQKQTEDIVQIYDDKYKKSSFFEELWEKQHPSEAKALKLEQEQKR